MASDDAWSDAVQRACPHCGDQLATDFDHGWVCLTCGEPRPDGGDPL